MRYLANLALAAISLISCSRDPNYLKQKYLQSGIKYYDAGRYKEANIMFRKSIEADRKFGPGLLPSGADGPQAGSGGGSGGRALRRAVELIKPGTDEANDSVLKLSEIMVVAAQGQANNDGLIKEVQTNVDGLLKRNPNGWEGHKLSGDIAMLQTSKLYRAADLTGAKKAIGDAIMEYRKALAAKPADPVINLALGRTLVVDGEYAEGAATLSRPDR